MTQTVLVIEDEAMIREAVSSYLRKQGCQVFSAETGKEAMAILEGESITFVILDLMLPDISGEEICSAIRKNSAIPVIMLTAKTQEEDILNGLQIGADDYMTKPFSLKELYARMGAILRRTLNDKRLPEETDSWNGGELSIDFAHYEICKGGKPLALTPSEWKILQALVRHPKKVYLRDELIELAFGLEFDGNDRVIDTHIKNLRKKLEDNPKQPVYIKTIHGLGYQFGGEGS